MKRVQVTLSDGVVEGVEEAGVRRFLSLPYAAPITQERRFREPQPVERWSGVRDATKRGPRAPQSIPEPMNGLDVDAMMGTPGPEGPDYLTLNVFTREDAKSLPVMVYIHGGGFVGGSKDVPAYDGSAFARDGVVCVVINYRLGIEGFLPASAIPTNLGLRDMIAALEWVRDNIDVFGGDPGAVTVFGESGGAWCIVTLIASPLAKGLFRRAICMSGHGYGSRSIGHMQKVVKRLAKHLRIGPDRAGFASVPIEKIPPAQVWVTTPRLLFNMKDRDGYDPSFGVTRFFTVHGDDVLPVETMKALGQGAGRDIDLLIGTTSEEANLFIALGGMAGKMKRWMAVMFMSKALPKPRDALRAYGLDQPGAQPGDVAARALTDLMFRAMTRRTAELHKGRSWVYEFEWRSPALGGAVGAAHSIEVPFVFDTLALAAGPNGLLGENPPQALADSIRAIWIRFATDGTAPWPQFDAETRQVYSLTRGVAEHEPPTPAVAFLPTQG
ncbi:carboxylesterase family protein [soil metagenome]